MDRPCKSAQGRGWWITDINPFPLRGKDKLGVISPPPEMSFPLMGRNIKMSRYVSGNPL